MRRSQNIGIYASFTVSFILTLGTFGWTLFTLVRTIDEVGILAGSTISGVLTFSAVG